MKMLLFLSLFTLGIFSLLYAEEVQGPQPPTPDKYFVSPFEVWKWRALEAEIKVIQLEANEALKGKVEEKKALEEIWKRRFDLPSLEGWVVDIQRGEIRKEGQGE